MSTARIVLAKLAAKVDGIDNGRCKLCRQGYRYYEGRKVGACSNPDCLSHEIRKALTPPKRRIARQRKAQP